MIHGIAPETYEERIPLPAKKTVRVTEEQGECADDDARPTLVLKDRARTQVAREADGTFRISLARLDYRVFTTLELASLSTGPRDHRVTEAIALPERLVVPIARSASRLGRSPSPSELAPSDARTLADAERSLASRVCKDALSHLERLSPGALGLPRALRVKAEALHCVGDDAAALRWYSALNWRAPFSGYAAVAARVKAGKPLDAVEPKRVAKAATGPVADATVLVFPLELDLPEGVLAAKDVDALFDLFAASLGEQGVRMVPPEDLERRLNEEQTESYAECYDSSCQIELGKELAANVVVQGKIKALGSSCLVTTGAYDLRTETSIRAGKRTVQCGVSDLASALEGLAKDLAH